MSDDESTAPERIAQVRITTIDTPFGRSRITVDDFLRQARNTRGDVHQPAPGVFTISNSTEFGEVYTPDELRALADCAHEHGWRVYVDGARFANAVASIGCDPRELANEAGVDAMSFGGTKNGLAFGEAVLFFPQGDRRAFERAVASFPFHRKATGHLLSKHRFVAAPFTAVLRDQVWLKHAKHANAMAARLAEGLQQRGITLPYAAQANAVFAQIAPELNDALIARGHEYYMFGEADWNLARFMCSFDTTEEDVDALLADVVRV